MSQFGHILRLVVRDTCRILTFRHPSAAIVGYWPAYLAFGLFFTWLAGVGRYWDNPRARVWQHAGLGSVAYVFGLALFLWLLLLPLRPKRWRYRNVLLFITLTAPPAVLYAVPVEQFMSLSSAESANALFLAVVAAWRVALLVWFLHHLAGLTGLTIVVATLLPLALIVVVLSALNLEHVVFQIMSGMGPNQRTSNDLAYLIVTLFAFSSVLASPFLLAGYGWLVFCAWREKYNRSESEDAGEAIE